MNDKNILQSLAGKKSARKRLRERGIPFYVSMGKKSAQSGNRTKEYYSNLGKKSAEAKRRKKEEKEKIERAKRNPLNQLNDFISGK